MNSIFLRTTLQVARTFQSAIQRPLSLLFVANSLLLIFSTWMAEAQAPQSFPYQAVARNSAGNLLANQNVSLRFTIHNLTATGVVLYRETQTATTNPLGLFSIKIGQGVPAIGTFNTIPWSTGSKYLQVEIDPAGGVAYTDMGTTQLMSVPYALYAENAGSASLSGTTNSLIKFTGPNTGGNSGVYENTAGNIGLGTFFPTHKLHINGGDLFVQSSIGKILFGYDGGNQWQMATTGAGADLRWSTTTDGGTSNTPRHYFSQNGNVGIGGFSGIGVPLARLHVIGEGASSVTNNFMLNNSAGDTLLRMQDDGRMGIGFNGSGYGRTLNIAGNGINFYTANGSGFGGAILPTDTSLILWSNSNYNNYIVMQPNWGNAGVGTYNPSAKFHVNGTFKLTDGSEGAGKILTSDVNGLASWSSPSGAVGGGTINYIPKFTVTGSILGNSLIQDNGANIGIGYTPGIKNKIQVFNDEMAANGDGQTAIYGARFRSYANNGVSYGNGGTNSAISGYNNWGDIYTFGEASHNYNDYNRCGGVLGAEINGAYWGSLGYRSSALLNYGVYGSAAYVSGTGELPNTAMNGIGGGFFGTIGSMSKGSVIGQLNEGELFAAYNKGDVYTSGKQIELVNSKDRVIPSFAVTSSTVTVYNKGKVLLVNGTATVRFDENYAQLLGEVPAVTASPMGECNGVYVTSVTKEGFVIKEQNHGISSVEISWISVGNRIDAADSQVPSMLTETSFNRNLSKALFNDGNRKQSGLSMWWNGKALQFGDMPASLTPTREEKSRMLEQENSVNKID